MFHSFMAAEDLANVLGFLNVEPMSEVRFRDFDRKGFSTLGRGNHRDICAKSNWSSFDVNIYLRVFICLVLDVTHTWSRW